MGKDITETIEIHNFLSLTDIKWEFGQFNIITGDMGSGKSLCIKLVQFFENIIPSLLIAPYESFLQYLENKNFYESLTKDFNSIFVLQATDQKALPSFKITYTFSYKNENFVVTVTGTNENDIVFESSFLENLLAEWGVILHDKNISSPEKVTPDGFKEIKLSLYNDLLNKFGNSFPMATTFVPASRAALAFGSSHTDNYLKEYKELVDVLPRFKSGNQEIINTILKAKMTFEDGFLFLESTDGRRVPIAKASSGQQEIVYVLLLLDKLGNFQYTYGKHHSLFIEEPSAHLFPLEQKQTLELIVCVYHHLRENGNAVRFFITTHSPYVLNSLNNMLKKGALLKKNGIYAEKINKEVDIPHLNADEISACFIDNGGRGESMLDDDKKYLYAEKISNISIAINETTTKLRELNNEFC